MFLHFGYRSEISQFKKVMTTQTVFLIHANTNSILDFEVEPRGMFLLRINKMCIEDTKEFRNKNGRDGLVEFFKYLDQNKSVPVILWRESKDFNIKLWLELSMLWNKKTPLCGNKVIELKEIVTKTRSLYCSCAQNLYEVMIYNRLDSRGMALGKDEPFMDLEDALYSTKLKTVAMFELLKRIVAGERNLMKSCKKHI